jgi:hypothetical protein
MSESFTCAFHGITHDGDCPRCFADRLESMTNLPRRFLAALAPHHHLCTCDKCMPAITLGGAVRREPSDIDVRDFANEFNCSMLDAREELRRSSAKTFDEAMREVGELRAARSETFWKLFRLSLCQSAVVHFRMEDLKRRAALSADGPMFLKPQGE